MPKQIRLIQDESAHKGFWMYRDFETLKKEWRKWGKSM